MTTAKRLKQTDDDTPSIISGPMGLVWNDNNWSCAYDSFFFILYMDI